ncbi:hypothetical protein KIH39_17130 [Telmatocola sphagniphila]|uniref:Sugar kinase n=1 Tax=Telmatocola sphagniphila TaxID=1123043 RepID=A0A8E6B293_9BACT|nr:hypothetical protein [Telmatocola sphagniphila]QVL30568.1 hypothetical protein KIH39_17130 [Telmatocola sphagniphila]
MGAGPRFEKIVVVTQKTALEELIERYNTERQARFYIEHMGGSFDEYRFAHDIYHNSLLQLKQYLPQGVRHQIIDRSFLPQFLFSERDMVAVLGRDGLVVNTAKYLQSQPVLGFNPDPSRIDGVLLPFRVEAAAHIFPRAIYGIFKSKRISMAQATLNNGQTLLGVNDIFIGPKSHTSARYRIQLADKFEDQSSSGLIVSTGAGSTGWFRSLITGAAALMSARAHNPKIREQQKNYQFPADSDHLVFCVREPFISNTSQADLIYGMIPRGSELILQSHMPQNGVIFSDGIESDFLEFNSGTTARIGLAPNRVKLVVAEKQNPS